MALTTLIRTAMGGDSNVLDMESGFIQNGGNSLKAIALAATLKSCGYKITREMILTCSSLTELAQQSDRSALPFTTVKPSIQISENTPDPKDLTVEAALAPRIPAASVQVRVRASDNPKFPSQGRETITPCAQDTSSASIQPFEPWHSTVVLDESVHPCTEMQLSTIHGTLSDGITNLIVHKEVYYADYIPILKAAWHQVMQSEAIFQGQWLRELFPEETFVFSWVDTGIQVPDSDGTSPTRRYNGRIGSFFEVSPSGIGPDGRPLSTITWTIHHAFVDGFSANMIFDKIRKIANGENALPGVSFWEWARDLQQYQQHRKAEGDAFWSSQSADHAEVKGELLLPATDRSNSVINGSGTHIHKYSLTLDDDVELCTREMGVTAAVAFYAAWALVLSVYADSNDVVFGAVLSCRNLPLAGTLDVVGPVMNVLPLHAGLQKHALSRDYLQSIFRSLLELESFSWTTPDNGFDRHYESAISVNFSRGDSSNTQNHAVQPLETSTTQVSNFPLSITVDDLKTVTFQYHDSRFAETTIVRIAESYNIAMRLLLHSHLTVGGIMEGLLSTACNRTLLRFGNCHSGLTNRTSIKDDLVTLFEKCARLYPDGIAVEKGGVQLSYSDLDRASSQVARKLGQSITTGDAVCVHSDKSVNWIVAIFGVLKAGGVYCSLDSALPAKLRDSMYGLANAKAFVTPTECQLPLSPAPPASTFSVDKIVQDTETPCEPEMQHRGVPQPASPAYICFTSGSTGTPKGVVCTHDSLVAFESDLQVRLQAQPGVRISQIMSVAFDGSIHEIFSALTHGATLVLPGGADPLGALGSVDSALLTPSIARLLDPEDYPKLKWVYLVGEPVPQTVNDVWASCKQLFNMYGPTEATCGATIKRLRAGEPVTIGGPNPTTRIYILNSSKRLCQPGMIGEIYLAGVQVSKGYLNMPEQTSERFLQDSVMGNLEMMYQTGDRGYWSESGEVVCLGRNDRQIKLRGYRLDMNDLEIRISRAVPSLKAVAIARSGDEMICMVQPRDTNTCDLRSRLSSVLPHYAIPHYLVAVDRIPTTKAGKIDYKAVVQQKQPSKEVESPATPTEKTVAAAFRAVLGLAEDAAIDASSNFACLGGNSLAQIRLASWLSSKLRVRVPLQLVISQPAVQDLASKIQELLPTASAPTKPARLGSEAVSPIEQDWLSKYEVGSGSACFNVSFAADFDEGSVDVDRFARAWNVVLRRHELFRCRYVIRGRGRAPQRVYTKHPPRAELVADFDLWSQVNRPFQLEREPPVRVVVSGTQLLVVMSHIVADYTTMSVLLREVSSLYMKKKLGAVRRTYSDADVWYEPAPPGHQDFWRTYLGDGNSSEPLTKRPGPSGAPREGNGYGGQSVFYMFEPSAARKIVQYSHDTNVTLQQMALASVALVLDREQSQTDHVIGLPYMNRKSEEDSETVGLFLEPLPVRIRDCSGLDDSLEFGKSAERGREMVETDGQNTTDQLKLPSPFLKAVQESTQEAVAHAMPWHQLLETLSITPDYPSHPIFDVMVSFHSRHMMQDLAMPGMPQLRARYVWSQGAKFRIMAEFMSFADDKLLLRLEYDDASVSEDEIRQLLSGIPLSMALLASSMTPQAVRSHLRMGDEAQSRVMIGSQVDAEKIFGTRVCEF